MTLDLRSLGGFEVGALLWEPNRGERTLSLCVKGTFTFVSGAEAAFASAQRPIGSSADGPCDLVPIKPRVDVLVTGAASADPSARLRVGGIEKELVRAAESSQFGAAHFSLRAERIALSGAARAWASSVLEGHPSGVAPIGFDFGVFNEAPADQRCDVLRRGEEITVAQFEGRLPSLKPKVLHFPAIGARAEVTMRCDTLLVDTDARELVLWWRGLVDVPNADPAALGAIVVAAEPAGRRLRVDEIERWVRAPLASAPEAFLEERGSSSEPPMSRRHDGLKVKVPEGELDAPTLKMSTPKIMRREEREPAEETINITSVLLPDAVLKAALPFIAPPAAPAPSVEIKAEAKTIQRPLELREVAEIAAEIAAGSQAAVLGARGIGALDWALAETRLAERLAKEAELGETALRDAYDAAFLEAREKSRGPFDAAALLRLRADLRAGVGARDLPDLGLDVADAMRVMRLSARPA